MMKSKRYKALLDGRTTFVGNPCSKCGGKVRYSRTGACQVCMRVHNRNAREKIKALHLLGKAAREAAAAAQA